VSGVWCHHPVNAVNIKSLLLVIYQVLCASYGRLCDIIVCKFQRDNYRSSASHCTYQDTIRSVHKNFLYWMGITRLVGRLGFRSKG